MGPWYVADWWGKLVKLKVGDCFDLGEGWGKHLFKSDAPRQARLIDIPVRTVDILGNRVEIQGEVAYLERFVWDGEWKEDGRFEMKIIGLLGPFSIWRRHGEKPPERRKFGDTASNATEKSSKSYGGWIWLAIIIALLAFSWWKSQQMTKQDWERLDQQELQERKPWIERF